MNFILQPDYTFVTNNHSDLLALYRGTPLHASRDYRSNVRPFLHRELFPSQAYPSARAPSCCVNDPYLPDLFLGDFLFRVSRSNFAEAGGRMALLITMSFAVTSFP